MSTFGTLFRVTTFGESHCKGVGAIVDGVPPGMALTEADVQPQLTRRRPGQSKLTTPRDEKDIVSVLSGTEHGYTLGTPIGLFVANQNVRKRDYSEMLVIPRPGHADYTYQLKYGIRASSGGGRSSARETIGRVAAGAIAEKWLAETYGTKVVAFVSSIGHVDLPAEAVNHPSGRPWTREEVDRNGRLQTLRDTTKGWKRLTAAEVPDAAERATKQAELDKADEALFTAAAAAASTEPAYVTCPTKSAADGMVDADAQVFDRNGNAVAGSSPQQLGSRASDDVAALRCPDAATAVKMATAIRQVKSEEDSIGGVITCVISNVPLGLGEPCFDKLEAKLAHGMLSLPATKGFDIGSGFPGTRMKGSAHNDMFTKHPDGSPLLQQKTNHGGGTLGGISSGADIVFRVAIKPVSTIGKAQQTADFAGNASVLKARGRHDPCVLPRASPLIEAMAALVIADAAMLQRARAARGSSLVVVHPQHVREQSKLPCAQPGMGPQNGSAPAKAARAVDTKEAKASEPSAKRHKAA